MYPIQHWANTIPENIFKSIILPSLIRYGNTQGTYHYNASSRSIFSDPNAIINSCPNLAGIPASEDTFTYPGIGNHNSLPKVCLANTSVN